MRHLAQALHAFVYRSPHGPSPQAFILRRRFEPDGRPATRQRLSRS